MLLHTTASTIGVAKVRARGRGFAASGGVDQAIRSMMVGRVRVELTTSRLSGVRSNHLSYRPEPAAPSVAAKLRPMARFAALSERSACKIAIAISSRGLRFPVMKGHEDGG